MDGISHSTVVLPTDFAAEYSRLISKKQNTAVVPSTGRGRRSRKRKRRRRRNNHTNLPFLIDGLLQHALQQASHSLERRPLHGVLWPARLRRKTRRRGIKGRQASQPDIKSSQANQPDIKSNQASRPGEQEGYYEAGRAPAFDSPATNLPYYFQNHC